jgi:anti-sigma factor RsiW
MRQPQVMNLVRGNPHLGDLVVDYVDGMLSEAAQERVERHLIVCPACLAQVREEREMLARLRDVRIDASSHHDLMSGLLSLAQTQAVTVVVEPQPLRPMPATLTAGAPAQYVSARRSVACAIAAVVGCIGVAAVAANSPAGAAAPNGGVQSRPASSTQAPSMPVTVASVSMPGRKSVNLTPMISAVRFDEGN